MPQPFPLPLSSSSLSKITREKWEGRKSEVFFLCFRHSRQEHRLSSKWCCCSGDDLRRARVSIWAHRQLFPLPGLSFALRSCFLSLSYSKTAARSGERPPGASPALDKYLGPEEQRFSMPCLKESLSKCSFNYRAESPMGLLVRAGARSSLKKAILQLMISYTSPANCRAEQGSLGRHLVEVFHSKHSENESKRNSRGVFPD